MPTVPGHLQQQLFNRDRDGQREITGTLPNQERLLQIDPRLLSPLPEGARQFAEAESIREAAQGAKDFANLLPEGSQVNVEELNPRNRNRQRQVPESASRQQKHPHHPRYPGDRGDYGFMDRLESHRQRLRTGHAPRNDAGAQRRNAADGFRSTKLPSRDGLTRQDDGGRGGSDHHWIPVGFAKRESTDTRTTYETTGHYAGYKVTYEQYPDSGVQITNVTTPDGRTYHIECTRRGNGEYNIRIYHVNQKGKVELIARNTTDRPLDTEGNTEVSWLIRYDRGEIDIHGRPRNRHQSDCAPDGPCGGANAPAPWEIAPGVFGHLRPKTPIEQVMEQDRPGAHVLPPRDGHDTQGVGLRIQLDERIPVWNPGFEPPGRASGPDPSRIDPFGGARVNPGPRPMGP